MASRINKLQVGTAVALGVGVNGRSDMSKCTVCGRIAVTTCGYCETWSHMVEESEHYMARGRPGDAWPWDDAISMLVHSINVDAIRHDLDTEVRSALWGGVNRLEDALAEVGSALDEFTSQMEV